MPFNLYIDTKSVVHPYNGILFNNRNEWTIDTHSTDEPQMCYAKTKNPDPKGYTCYMFSYMTFWKSSCQGLRVEGTDFNGHALILESDKIILLLDCSGGYATTHLSTFTKL